MQLDVLRAGAPTPLLSRTAEERLGLRHREILDQLESLFLDRGFASSTIGDIAAEIGCSRRTLYEIASSKEQLVLIVLDRFLHKKGRAALDSIDHNDDLIVQLRRYIVGGIEFHLERSLFEDLSDDAPARRLLDRHFRFVMTVFQRLVTLGIQRGDFRDINPGIVAGAVAGSTLFMSQPEIIDDIGLDLRTIINELLDYLLPALVEG
ncbi:MAG: TetR/AcrR family transcriptional regulator [Acidimicrobiia bacterium]